MRHYGIKTKKASADYSALQKGYETKGREKNFIW